MKSDVNKSSIHSSPELMNVELGTRLRVLREAFGLSQRELAKRAGITNSNISMIEQGQISPSVQSLNKILDGLSVSLVEFFSYQLASENPPICRADDILEHAYTSEEGIVIHHVDTEWGGDIQLSRQYFNPGVESSLRVASQDISGWIISGTLHLHSAQRDYDLHQGDAFYIKSDQLYQISNKSSELGEVILANFYIKKAN